MNEFQLGQRVSFTHPLQRRYQFMEGDRYGRKEWVPQTDYKGVPESGAGIIIGKRTLANGVNHYNGYDEPITFHPKETFTAYLVAFDLRRKPVHVLPEHITALEPQP
jgi:hypothetical protein